MEQQLFNLKNKVILITGGAGLIGRSFVEALYENGADVIIGDINYEKVQQMMREIKRSDFNNSINYVELDITSEESVTKALQNILDSYGKIDILINNAYPRNKNYGRKYEDIELSDWKENVDMHLNGYFLITHKVSQQMIKQKCGKIINISSIYGMRGPRFHVYEGTEMTMPAEYSVIKGGILNYTKYLASYLGPYNINVNAISLGGVFDHQPDSFVKRYEHLVPLKRMATTQDVKGIIVFLSSDSSNYITGQNLVVDGGWTAI